MFRRMKLGYNYYRSKENLLDLTKITFYLHCYYLKYKRQNSIFKRKIIKKCFKDLSQGI